MYNSQFFQNFPYFHHHSFLNLQNDQILQFNPYFYNYMAFNLESYLPQTTFSPFSFHQTQPIKQIYPQKLEENNNPTQADKQFKKQKNIPVLDQFSIRKQSYGKNMQSNTLKYFVNYLKNKDGIANRVKSILKANKYELSIEQFHFLVQKCIKPKKYYCNIKILKNVIYEKEINKQFSSVIRILLRIFLKQQIKIFLKKSPRMKRESKLTYFKIGRKILSTIL